MTTITTGTSGPQAWKIALVAGAVGLATLVVVNLPQNTSDTTGQQAAATATATLPESVTGFEYGNESTSGHVATPGVTTQYAGNSGELFPYENGPAPQTVPSQAEINRLAPVITQEYLDGPSSATQGATRIDPGAAAAAGFNPGEIDTIVGNTQVASPTFVDLDQMIEDMIAQEQTNQAAQAQALAAADEALVNPVLEVNAAQLIAEIIASERSAPAAALASPDEALVRGVSTDTFDWQGLGGPYENGTVAEYYAAESGAADASVQAWQEYVDAVSSGSVAALYESNASDPLIGDPADIKFLGTSTQSAGTQRIPQQNVSMR